MSCSLGLFVALLMGPSALAGDSPQESFEGMVEVREVLLDVLATNKDGQIVRGLGPRDFMVEEDGEELEITGASYYTTRYTPDGSRRDLAEGEVPSSRYFVLFFHDPGRGGSISNYVSRQLLDARRGSLRWVEEHLLPSDWVAVASFDIRLKLHQDFTQDRLALAKGIKNAISRRNPESGGRRGRKLPSGSAPSLLRHLPEGKALRKEARTLYDGLRLVGEAAGWTVGRKNLLLFSVGFGEFDLSAAIPRPDPQRYPAMEQAFNNSNVAVYPIDLTPIEVRHFQGQILQRLALDTGGRYQRDPISFLSPLQNISEENAGYYLLSYRSEHPAAEEVYQAVTVEARDPEVRLRVRRGYRYGPR